MYSLTPCTHPSPTSPPTSIKKYNIRSFKTPTKRPPIGPRAMDTPGKRGIHRDYGPRKRLFTSGFAVPSTPQPNHEGSSILRTPGWHRSRHEWDDMDSQPLRLSSPTSPAMTTFRGMENPGGNDPVGEEILKNLFERWLLSSIVSCISLIFVAGHAQDVKRHGRVVAFEWFVRGVGSPHQLQV